MEKGITNLDNIGFVASDEALDEAQDEALKKAVNDAQKQANAVLSAIDKKQTSIVSVQVGDASPRMFLYAKTQHNTLLLLFSSVLLRSYK